MSKSTSGTTSNAGTTFLGSLSVAYRRSSTKVLCRYIDEAFEGPRLQPDAPLARAKVGQAVAIMDSYAYRSLVWGIYFARVEAPRLGRAPDLRRIEAAREQGATCLSALEAIDLSASWLVGDRPTLADFHAAPMFHLFMQAEDAAQLMRDHPRLQRWWARVSEHIAPAEIVR